MHIHHWPGRGAPIVALHGFTGSGADFEAIAPSLAGPVLCPDLPGHGACPEERITLPALAERLAAWFSDLSPRGVILLGYSMGGRVSLQLALDHPKLIRGLILIGASPGIQDPEARRARRDSDAELARRILEMSPSAFARWWSESEIIRSQRRIPARWRRGMERRRALNNPAGLAAALEGFGTGAMPWLGDRLGELRAETLLITGANDLKFQGIAQEMSAIIPRSRRVSVADAGHCAHLEQPAATLEALSSQLSLWV